MKIEQNFGNPEKSIPLIIEQTTKTFSKLLAEYNDMRHEFANGNLSSGVKAQLKKQLEETYTSLEILRNSLKALNTPGALLVSDPKTLSFEITDNEEFLYNKFIEKTQEVTSLQDEREMLFDLHTDKDKLTNALAAIEDRISFAQKDADEAYEVYRNREQK